MDNKALNILFLAEAYERRGQFRLSRLGLFCLVLALMLAASAVFWILWDYWGSMRRISRLAPVEEETIIKRKQIAQLNQRISQISLAWDKLKTLDHRLKGMASLNEKEDTIEGTAVGGSEPASEAGRSQKASSLSPQARSPGASPN